LFDESWVAEDMRIDWGNFIAIERIETVNTIIGESEIRLDLYDSM
jgi:hypothetical protein